MGTRSPQWSTCREALQSQCTCAPVHSNHPRICRFCSGAMLPRGVRGPPAPCFWCRGVVGDICPGCNSIIHSRAQCNAWNSGAAPGYLASALQPTWLCPDCSWEWTTAVGRARNLGAPPRGAAATIMSEGAATKRAVAGSLATPQVRAVHSRSGRRWLLWYLRNAGDWISLEDIRLQVPHRLGGRHCALTDLRCLLANVTREGVVRVRNSELGPLYANA